MQRQEVDLHPRYLQKCEKTTAGNAHDLPPWPVRNGQQEKTRNPDLQKPTSTVGLDLKTHLAGRTQIVLLRPALVNVEMGHWNGHP
jgi:hypothetical protein